MARAATQTRQARFQEWLDEHCRHDQEWPEDLLELKQGFLPPFRWLLQPDSDRFAHPAEVELARLLTFYGVRWAYEPTTFAVRWGSDGHPQEFVTPDFYLPDHDSYLELTTMKQRLVTRKNRKFRKLRECYPNVRVRILYQRDFERLQDAFGRPELARTGEIGAMIFSASDLEARLEVIAGQLVESWQSRPGRELRQRPLLLGVGGGSRRFLNALCENVRALGVPADSDRVDLTAMAAQDTGARVRISRPPSSAPGGRDVVVVQEVVSSGLSAAFLEAWLRRQGANEVAVCALLDREAARVLDVPMLCRGFTAPDVALAGYGLARWGEYRDLPYIAEIRPTADEQNDPRSDASSTAL